MLEQHIWLGRDAAGKSTSRFKAVPKRRSWIVFHIFWRGEDGGDVTADVIWEERERAAGI